MLFSEGPGPPSLFMPADTDANGWRVEEPEFLRSWGFPFTRTEHLLGQSGGRCQGVEDTLSSALSRALLQPGISRKHPQPSTEAQPWEQPNLM